MGPVRIRHSSHDFGWQSSHSVDLAGWQAKMASIEIWIPWRNAHKPHLADFTEPLAYYTLESILPPTRSLHLNVNIEFDAGMVLVFWHAAFRHCAMEYWLSNRCRRPAWIKQQETYFTADMPEVRILSLSLTHVHARVRTRAHVDSTHLSVAIRWSFVFSPEAEYPI